MATLPVNPANPERVCWGCDNYCPADDLRCGNGTIRTPHPCELFGDDWMSWRPPGTKTEADEPLSMLRRRAGERLPR